MRRQEQSLTIAPSTTVSTRAPQGVKGTWLLDPADLEVVGAGGTGTIAAGTNSIADSTIAAATIVTALDGNNVDLQATNSITVSAAINATPNTNSGNLTLTAPTTNLNQAITLKPRSTLNGTATIVNVGTTGTVQNGVDAALAGGTVNLAAATYTLAQEVEINKNIIVRGAAANTTTVSGDNTSRVFNVRSNVTATLDKMTIANGNPTSNPYSSNGAGIYNEGQLTLSNSIISQNTAASFRPSDEPKGGGIFNSGILNVVDTVISNNTSTASYGGGIASTGTLNINRSTLSGNSSKLSGGGLINFGSATISNTTISGNTAGIDGGGLVDYSGSPTSTQIINSTISGNTANASGGGILTIHPMNIVNSTIVNNTALNDGGGITNKSQINIANSVVAGNISQADFSLNEIADKDGGVMTSQGNNLVGQNGNAGGFTRIASDIIVPGSIAAPIGALANNGGTTQTHAVFPGSLAIDAANPATATTTGQTGNAIAGAARDIGAYEFGGFQFNLRTISGTPQSTVVGTNFQPLVIEVRPNIAGQPVAGGTIVAFTPNSNANGAGIANTAVQSVTIGANNQASITPTANTVTGTHTVVANATGNTGTAQTFTLTNTPDVAATLASTGSGQAAVVNTDFAVPLQLVVRDQYNNVIPGAIVAFSSPANTGATGLLNGTTNTAVNGTTDLNGIITIAVRANTVAGNYNTTATTGGLSSTFALTNNPDVAALVTTTGGTQSTTVATGFTNALQTRVTDQYGNPISGAAVNFTVPGGSTTTAGGTPSGTTATTDANGLATVIVTANTKAGAFVATSSVNGVTPIAQYNLTNVAASPSSVTATGGSTQSTTVATPFSNALQATVVDLYGNPVQGAIVTFALPVNGASATASSLTATTDVNGLASITVNANTIAGSYRANGNVNALTAQYRLTNLAGAATTVTASGSGQTAVINTGFTNPLQATVTDTYGNPISGATVNFTVPTTGASGTVATATATTNANGVATTTVTANGTVGAYAATGVVTGLTNASYTLTNVANLASIPATIAVINNTSNQSTTINTPFTNPLQVLVSNNTGAPLANTPVTFTLPSAIGTSASTLTVFTDGSGIATLPVSALGTAGTFNPIATVNSLTTQFTLTNNPIAVIPVNPVNPITPSNPVSLSNSGILTSVEQVRIGQDLQRLNPNAKTPAVTSGGSSSLCIVRDREEQNKNTIFDRQGDNQKIAESQKLPDCKPTEKETLITK